MKSITRVKVQMEQLSLGSKGFSLIELMIVVAIIGILATVAVPNFSRFQAKARASEARAQLSALYKSQRAFQAEWNGFHTDIINVGYRPNGTLRYVVGHATASSHTIPAYTGPTLTPGNMNTAVAAVCTTAGCVNGAQNSAGTALDGTAVAGTATLSAFSARAAGFVGGTATDVWEINQDRAISNTTPGGF